MIITMSGPSSTVQLSQQVLGQPFLKSIRRPTPLALQAVIEDGVAGEPGDVRCLVPGQIVCERVEFGQAITPETSNADPSTARSEVA
jgi:hypothetical protein